MTTAAPEAPPATGLKITFDRAAMLAAVNLAGSVVKTNTPSLIMKNVKLQIGDDGTAAVSASDGEVQIRVAVEGVEAIGSGAMLLDPQKVSAILKTAESDSVSFEVKGSEILIADGKSRFRLPSENPDHFPTIEPTESEGFHEVQAADLALAIKRTVYAVSPSSTRYPSMEGVYLSFSAGRMKAVATDGVRLAIMVVPASEVGRPAQNDSRPSVPVKAVRAIQRVCELDRPVAIVFTSSNMEVRSGPVDLVCRILQGNFPKHEPVSDSLPANSAPFVASEIADSIERAGVTCDEVSSGVSFVFSEGALLLSSKSREKGSASVVANSRHEFTPDWFLLHHKYAVEALRVIPGDSVVEVGIEGDRHVHFRTSVGYAAVVTVLSKENHEV